MFRHLRLAMLVFLLFLAACGTDSNDAQVGFVSGDYALVARDRQVHVVEIARPSRPRWIATIDVPGRVIKVEVRGQIAYIVHYPSVDSWSGRPPDGGLLIADIARPKRPRVLGVYHSPSLAQDVDLAGEIAYVADWEGVRVVDVSDPANPAELASLTDGMSAVAVQGNYLYAAWGNCSLRTAYCDGGLWVADITSPEKPVELGIYHPAERPGYSVAVHGDVAYVAGNGLWLANVSDKRNPREGEYYELLEGRYQSLVATAGDHLFLVTEKGLRLFNLATPGDLVQVSFLPLTAFVSDIAVRDEHAYLVSNEGLHVIDITDPEDPQIVGYYSGIR